MLICTGQNLEISKRSALSFGWEPLQIVGKTFVERACRLRDLLERLPSDQTVCISTGKCIWKGGPGDILNFSGRQIIWSASRCAGPSTCYPLRGWYPSVDLKVGRAFLLAQMYRDLIRLCAEDELRAMCLLRERQRYLYKLDIEGTLDFVKLTPSPLLDFGLRLQISSLSEGYGFVSWEDVQMYILEDAKRVWDSSLYFELYFALLLALISLPLGLEVLPNFPWPWMSIYLLILASKHKDMVRLLLGWTVLLSWVAM